MKKTISQIVNEVHEVNVEKGWFDTDRSYNEGLMLIATEVAEAVEAYREYGLEDVTAPPLEGIGLVMHQKPEGVGSELADIRIRIADEAFRQNVELDNDVVFVRPPAILVDADTFAEQMFVLLRVIAAFAAANRSLAVQWVILEAVANLNGIDLEAEYERKIAFNRTRPARHGGKRL